MLDESYNVTDKLSVSNKTTPDKHKIIRYQENGENIRSINEIEANYKFKRFLLGIETGVSLYFVVWDNVRFSPGIWYNYDIMQTDRYNNNYHNIRWGFSFKLAYMF